VIFASSASSRPFGDADQALTDAEVRVTQPSTSDVAVAHGTFLDELAAGRIRHAG
jgi:hypothetical protein